MKARSNRPLRCFSIRTVFATPQLFKYDFFFFDELRGVEEGVQDGITEHVETGFPEATGNGHVVHGLVVTGPGIDGPPCFDESGDFPVWESVPYP